MGTRQLLRQEAPPEGSDPESESPDSFFLTNLISRFILDPFRRVHLLHL